MTVHLLTGLIAFGLLAGAAQAQWLETTIPTDSGPYALCYNTLDNKVYCANFGDSSVTVIDGATNQVIATVGVGSWPCALCHNPHNSKVYCANQLSASVTVIDGATNQVVATIRVGGIPCALCYNPRYNKVYCANAGGGSVSVIDGASDTVLATLEFSHNSPHFLCYNTVSDKVYVALGGNGTIAVVDGGTNQLLTTLGGPDTPGRLCYNSGDNEVYCRCGLLQSSYDVVEAIDGAGDSILYSASVGLGGGEIDYYHGTGKVYCANPGNNSVSVIDPDSHHVIAAVATGSRPKALGYSLTNNKVYCANGADSTVTVIDGATNSVLKTIAVGTSPIALAYNPAQNRIYVANYGSRNVSVLRDSATGIEKERTWLVDRRVALEVYPNPFSGQVSLRLTARAGTEACPYRPELRIYDVNGALVRDFSEIRDSPQRDSPRFLNWDGTDDMGRPLPNGVYLVRVTNGNTSASKQVLLLR